MPNTSQKLSGGEIFGIVIGYVFLALLFGPLLVFEMNAHSGVEREYQIVKRGWVNFSVEDTRGNQVLGIRDREARLTVTCFGGRGCAPSSLTEEFVLHGLPAPVQKDKRYEFHIRCTELGPIPVLAMRVRCEALAIKPL